VKNIYDKNKNKLCKGGEKVIDRLYLWNFLISKNEEIFKKW